MKKRTSESESCKGKKSKSQGRMISPQGHWADSWVRQPSRRWRPGRTRSWTFKMDHRSVKLEKAPKNLGLTWNGTSENSSSPTNMEKVLTMERPRWSKNFGFSSSSSSFFIILASSECRRIKKPRPKATMKREYLRWKWVFLRQYLILRLIIISKYHSRKVRKVVRTLKNIVE